MQSCGVESESGSFTVTGFLYSQLDESRGSTPIARRGQDSVRDEAWKPAIVAAASLEPSRQQTRILAPDQRVLHLRLR